MPTSSWIPSRICSRKRNPSIREPESRYSGGPFTLAWSGFRRLAGGPICQAATAKCVESRHSALTLLYELELKVGRHAQVLPELAELYAQNPTHEKFCMLLMRALYRTGRQRDALDVYRACRRNLVESLGIEPTPALRQYEKAILTHDPLLT